MPTAKVNNGMLQDLMLKRLNIPLMVNEIATVRNGGKLLTFAPRNARKLHNIIEVSASSVAVRGILKNI
jgi:hypothetical protein